VAPAGELLRWNAEEETQTEKVPYGHAFLFEMAYSMPTPITAIFGQSCSNHRFNLYDNMWDA